MSEHRIVSPPWNFSAQKRFLQHMGGFLPQSKRCRRGRRDGFFLPQVHIALNPSEQAIESEHPAHVVDLIETHPEKEFTETGQSLFRQIAATVQGPLTRGICLDNGRNICALLPGDPAADVP